MAHLPNTYVVIVILRFGQKEQPTLISAFINRLANFLVINQELETTSVRRVAGREREGERVGGSSA